MLRALLSTMVIVLALVDVPDARAGGPAKSAITKVEGEDRTSADRLIGMPVLTEDGKQIGLVEDLIRDRRNRMRGVVVTVGPSEHRPSAVGVAWNQATIRAVPGTGEALIILGLTSDDLEATPARAADAAANAEDGGTEAASGRSSQLAD